MAQLYFKKLSELVSDLDIESEACTSLKIKHFFSGAALFADDVICASWSPAGLAFKLAGAHADELLSSGKAKPLKYFEKGHIKHGYVTFENPESSQKHRWKSYFHKAIDQAQQK